MNLKRAFVYLSCFVCLASFCTAQTAVLAPLPRQCFVDSLSLGKPLASGLIYTCSAGTSCPGTPLATFTDSTGVIQNQNPIQLDGAGCAAIWLSTGLGYKFVAQNSLGVQEWSADNVTGLASTLTTSIASVTTVAFSATPTFASLAQNQLFKMTLTGNVTSSSLVMSGITPPGLVSFEITQDGTGGRTFVWPVTMFGAVAPSTCANCTTIENFLWDGATALLVSAYYNNSGVGSLVATGINTPALNGINYVDGNTYPCTSAGIIAGLSAATGQFNAEGCLSGVTSSSEFDVGSTIKTGVSFRHPSGSTWTFSGTGGTACGIKLFDGNSFSGDGSTTGGFVLQAAASANLDSLLCTDPSVVSGNYTRTANIQLYNPSGGTFAKGLLHIEGQTDGTEFQNVTVANYNGIGAYFRSMCCSAHTIGLVANGNSSTGAQPLKFDADSTHLVVGNTFLATSIDHPGVTKNNMLLTGTNKFWCGGNNFFGLYMEGPLGTADNTTAAIDDNCLGSALFAGVRLGNDTASSTRYLLQIETGNEGVTALNLESGISNNIVNDLANGVTVVAAHPYQPINYISVPSYFVTEQTQTLQVNASVAKDGGGFKHKRFGATCSTAATTGTTCTTTYSWTTAFADANYTPVCTPVGPTQLGVFSINSFNAAGVTIVIDTATNAAASYSGVDCIAIHD